MSGTGGTATDRYTGTGATQDPQDTDAIATTGMRTEQEAATAGTGMRKQNSPTTYGAR